MLRICRKARYIGRRGTSADEGQGQAHGHAAYAYTRAQVYTRVGELGKLQAASWAYTRESELESYIKKGGFLKCGT